MRGRSHKRMRSGLRATAASSTLSDVQYRSIFTPSFSLDETRLFREAEDRRQWHPDPDPPAQTVHGRPARFSVAVTPFHTVHSRPFIARSYFTNMPRGVQVPVGIKFRNPLSVTACIRRKVRRMVMFAKGKTRKGSSSRRRQRNAYSSVRC